MDGFRLSPGITPFLTDLFVVELPIAVALGFLLGRSRGVFGTLGANALALGAIKVVTDYPDLPDDVVAFAALVAGGFFLLLGLRASARVHRPTPVVAFGGVLLVAIGVLKIYSDFYDPFDVLLADLTFVAGCAAILRHRGAEPSSPSRTREATQAP
ncbi:MAG: hypothetical protein L3K15_03595 [Thermoplasmata archaeon]|nr:hypothetical protein [Thermoplasmata archaeon]